MIFVPYGMDETARKTAVESLYFQIYKKLDYQRPAIFCLSDLYGYETLHHFVSKGIRVPEQVGIAGFDDIISFTGLFSGLTTIHQNVRLKAETAVNSLVKEIIEGNRQTKELETLLPVKLVKRETTN